MIRQAEKTEEREARELAPAYGGNISTRMVVSLGATVALLGIVLWILVVVRFRG